MYLLALLIPLVVHNPVMKGMDTFSQKEVNGLLDALRLVRLDILFNLGYALLWIGLFAALRKGPPRVIVTILFHVVSLLVVLVTPHRRSSAATHPRTTWTSHRPYSTC